MKRERTFPRVVDSTDVKVRPGGVRAGSVLDKKDIRPEGSIVLYTLTGNDEENLYVM